MSRIYFHSEHGTAEVSGRERANFGVLCGDVASAMVGLGRFDAGKEFRPLVPALNRGDDYAFAESFGLRFRMAEGYFTLPDARQIEMFAVVLNTVLLVGSDTLKLAARLHGQCEIHGYVEGADRAWMADMIERGRAEKVLRAGMGWESVVTLLRSRDDEPVVTSYSVCEQFPNYTIAGWQTTNDGDDWYELPESDRWERALTGLRERAPRFQPADWGTYRFMDRLTVLDVQEIALAIPPSSPPEKG